MHPRSPICRPCDFCLTQNLKLITGNSLTPARLAFENRQFLPSRAQSHSRAPVTPLSPFFLRPEQRATVVPQLPFSDLSSTRPSRLSADQAITYRMEPQASRSLALPQSTRGTPHVGQDLQSGNLSQAQSDFAAIHNNVPSITGHRSQIRQSLRCSAGLRHRPAGSAILRFFSPPSPPSSFRRLG
jgi:hypothetical protein